MKFSFIKIVLYSVFSAVVYGILHDLVTAHVCVEYFTVAHPRVIESENPIILALVWGAIATWWVGLILGVLLGAAARWGSNPKLELPELVPKIRRLLGAMGVCALLAGIVGFALHSSGFIGLRGPLAVEVSENMHSRFFFDAFAHTASYLVGFVGGLVVAISTFRERRRMGASS